MSGQKAAKKPGLTLADEKGSLAGKKRLLVGKIGFK